MHKQLNETLQRSLHVFLADNLIYTAHTLQDLADLYLEGYPNKKYKATHIIQMLKFTLRQNAKFRKIGKNKNHNYIWTYLDDFQLEKLINYECYAYSDVKDEYFRSLYEDQAYYLPYSHFKTQTYDFKNYKNQNVEFLFKNVYTKSLNQFNENIQKYVDMMQVKPNNDDYAFDSDYRLPESMQNGEEWLGMLVYEKYTEI